MVLPAMGVVSEVIAAGARRMIFGYAFMVYAMVGIAVIGFMVGEGGIASVFILFAVIAVIGAFASLRMIETRGRRLEDIAA